MASHIDPIERFLANVKVRPNQPAVAVKEKVVTYGELADRVFRIAAALADVAPHPRVLIHLPQGADAYAAMLATLLAGGYYAPTNVQAPMERQHLIRDRFRPDVVVTNATEAPSLGLGDTPTIDVDDLPDARLTAPRTPHDLAYVMFTSGSTGIPKGVMVGRTSLAHYVAWIGDAMAPGPQDRWSQHPNVAFDLSVLDIYGALCFGATLYPLISQRDRLMPGDFVRRNALTIWDSVPSVIDQMRNARQVNPECFKSLRLLTFCGEPLLPEHLDAIFAAAPSATVHNTYGPTEATVSCTLIRLAPDTYRRACGTSVALGEPIPGMSITLEGGSTPDEGEIYIHGPQVARGYWLDDNETAAKFRPADASIKTTYRTGDMAVRVDGQLFFQARVDRQVKLHGHRIELGDIDAALRSLGFTLAHTVKVGERLVATVESDTTVDQDAILVQLKKMLPDYCCPSQIVAIPSLPRNVNDKVDSERVKEMVRNV